MILVSRVEISKGNLLWYNSNISLLRFFATQLIASDTTACGDAYQRNTRSPVANSHCQWNLSIGISLTIPPHVERWTNDIQVF